MKWPTVQLQELASPEKRSIVSGPFGSSISSRFFVESGIPVIRGNNLTIGQKKFIDDGFAYLTEQKAAEFANCEAIVDDIIFTAAGSLGQVGIIPADSKYPKYIISNKQLRVRLNQDKVAPLFVYYWLTIPIMTRYIQGMNNGGAVPLINLGIIRRLPIPLPPIDVQERIVGIISTYDDLIENNRRRIALLEEAARLLYREWFVHLRFPGHEHTPIVDGVPQGWRVDNLGSVCTSVNDGDWIETKDQGGEDYRLLQVSNIGINEFVETGKYRYITERTFRELNCQEVVPGDILISRMPKPTGRAWLVTDMPWKMITAVDVAIAKANETIIDSYFLLYHLNSYRNIELSKKHATGATRPRISRRNLCRLPILVPPENLQRKFRAMAENIGKQKHTLAKQSTSLRKARDLLLPRLMNGEIAV